MVENKLYRPRNAKETTMICLCQACFYAFNLSGPYEFSLKIVNKRNKDLVCHVSLVDQELVNKHRLCLDTLTKLEVRVIL